MATPEQSASSDAAAPLGTIIHRKAQAGRAEHQARAMSLAKALRLTIAKVADTMLDMSMGVISARRSTCGGEDLGEPLQLDGLRMIFDGPGRSRAAIILDADMVAALIQQQTMGKVLPDTGKTPRILTATDAAVCAPFLETVLKQAAKLAEDPKDQQVIAGYQYGVWAEDARILGMALDAQDYDLIHLDLDISGGVRQGHIFLCMPQRDSHTTIPDPVTNDPGPGVLEPGVLEVVQPALPHLSETIMNIEAEVRISLMQSKLSLRELGQLEVGSQLDLDTARFDKVAIQTIAGKTIARGVLGQLDGQRAVQVQTARPAQISTFSAGQGDQPQARGMTPADADFDALSDPAAPELPDLGDMPDLPDLSNLEGVGDVPDLPDLPDLSDMPDLSDLPDLND